MDWGWSQFQLFWRLSTVMVCVTALLLVAQLSQNSSFLACYVVNSRFGESCHTLSIMTVGQPSISEASHMPIDLGLASGKRASRGRKAYWLRVYVAHKGLVHADFVNYLAANLAFVTRFLAG